MANINHPEPRPRGGSNEELIAIHAKILQGVMRGETNNTGDVTLRANQVTTVVTDIKVHANSDIFLTPKTANAASVNTPWISSIR